MTRDVVWPVRFRSARAAARGLVTFAIALLTACGSTNKRTAPPLQHPTLHGDGHARVLERNGDGGILELTGDPESAQQEAEAAMREHCGGEERYVVTKNESENGIQRTYYECGSMQEPE